MATAYTLRVSESATWKIADGDPSKRWWLCFNGGDGWRTLLSYTAPGAAALAVASGDTGIDEWDEARRGHHDVDQFVLSKWQRQ
jgi:hypothetical protein